MSLRELARAVENELMTITYHHGGRRWATLLEDDGGVIMIGETTKNKPTLERRGYLHVADAGYKIRPSMKKGFSELTFATKVAALSVYDKWAEEQEAGKLPLEVEASEEFKAVWKEVFG